MSVNQCAKAISCSLITVPKERKRDAATITDPWEPICQKCLEKEYPRPSLTNCGVDMNEYTKAINYINSIHALLNESVLVKPNNGSNSVTSLKTHIGMPDLPNFLTLFSCITANNNNTAFTNSNNSNSAGLNNQSSANTNHIAVSTTTSTSSISNCTFNVEHNVQTTQTVVQCNEENEDNNSDIWHTQADDDNAQHEGNNTTQPTFDDIVFDSDIYHDMAASELEDVSRTSVYHISPERHVDDNLCKVSRTSVYHTSPEKHVDDNLCKVSRTSVYHISPERHVDDNLCKNCQNSLNSIKNGQPNKTRHRQYESPNSPQSRQILQKNKESEEISQDNCKKDYNKYATTPAPPKKVKKETAKKQPVVTDSKERPYERKLSSSELDRYASELLIGKECKFYETPVIPHKCYAQLSTHPPRSAGGERPKTPKSYAVTNETSNNDTARRKQPPQKSTCIPVKQVRPNSPSNKLRPSSSASSPTKSNKMHVSNSASFTNQGIVNSRHIKPNYPNVIRVSDEGTIRQEKHELTKPKFKSVSNNKPQVLQYEQPITPVDVHKKIKKVTNCSRRSPSPVSQSSLSSIAAYAKAYVSEQKKLKPNSDKRSMTTYRVEQKDADDFICGKRNNKAHSRLRKLSSESTIPSDKDESPGDICMINTITEFFDDFCDAKKQKQRKRSNTNGSFQNSSRNELSPSSRRSSRNNMQAASRNSSDLNLHKSKVSQRRNESLLITVPIKKRESRNKPFRQARSVSPNSEDEVVNINHFHSPTKSLNHSDSNSNFSHTTGSSDIKSDRDYSPVQAFRV